MKCVIIIPALNPREDLIAYIEEILSLDIGPVLLVDDGSDAATHPIFGAAAGLDGCTLLRHNRNFGKGKAIKTGIAYCRQHFSGLLGAITVDCDGQHRVADVRKVYERMRAEPTALVLGCRDFGKETPVRSKIGNTLISFGMNLLYGVKLKDTQTGLRGIPEAMFGWVANLPGNRYEYELNMLIIGHKMAVRFAIETIETVYFDNNKGSHYRTIFDSFRIFLHLSRAFVQYLGSSALSAIVDIAAFILLSQIFFSSLPLGQRLLLATVTARLLSSIVNYSVNRRLVYAQSGRIYPTMIRYYSLWFCQLLSSFSLVWLISANGPNEVFVKIAVDLCLALISYQIQLRWVFREGKKPNRGKCRTQ